MVVWGSVRSSSGREKVVYVGRAWSGNLGDRDDRVDLIGSGNLLLATETFKVLVFLMNKKANKQSVIYALTGFKKNDCFQ